MSLKPPIPERSVLRQLHKSPRKYVEGWLDAPAHIHHAAFRMANPAIERQQSRKEFQELLQCLDIKASDTVLENKVGFGVATALTGNRLIAIWEAHTEYYSYQIWHIPSDPAQILEFGHLTYPGYTFPFSPLDCRLMPSICLSHPRANLTNGS